MHNLPIHWSEGMFLRPQHFQAADRYRDELTALNLQWSNAYSYGLRRLEINREALGNSQFQVTLCQARLRDGTVVALEGAGQLPRIDLKSAFEKQSQVTILLAVPKSVLGRTNVVREGNTSDGLSRYSERVLAVQDESNGGDEQSIEFLTLNAKLLTSLDDASGYETLPIARVKRATVEEASPEEPAPAEPEEAPVD